MGLDPVLQRSHQAVLDKVPLEAEHRALGHVPGLVHPNSHRRSWAGPDPGGDPDGIFPHYIVQLVPLLRRQPESKFISDLTATSRQLQVPKDYIYRPTIGVTLKAEFDRILIDSIHADTQGSK